MPKKPYLDLILTFVNINNIIITPKNLGVIMNIWIADWTSDVWHFIVRMIVAVICGFIIGFERKTRSKEAGVRTHAIVCLAACLFMILSKYISEPLFSDIQGSTFNADTTRIASQVVTGIGFLGAGIIMYRRDIMHGLTTAAGIWATAAIGMAIGSGFIIIGIVATALIVLIQLIMHLPIKAFQTRHIAIIKMQVIVDDEHILDEITQILGAKKITSYKVKSTDGKLVATVEVSTYDEFSPDKLNQAIRTFPNQLLSIERSDDNG